MKVSIMCGLPGSGKTYWIKENRSNNCLILSLDELREAVPIDIWTVQYEVIIKAALDNIIIGALKEGFSIFIDETCTYKKRRSKLLSLVKNYSRSIQVDLIYVDTNINMCKTRRRSFRMGKNPTEWSEAITNMDMKFERPTPEEGFNNIITV